MGVLRGPKTWLLRDIHSPNLFWLPERDGIARIGLIDFQDAMIGSPAYDLASLAMDARVSVPEELELSLIARYVKARMAAGPGFDAASFTRDYAVIGAQRLTKILGIFARLDRRDGKPGYLLHMPRIRAYLDRALAHPALSEVKLWFETFVFPHERRP
jgi:aminoglycoside/choline kinase family phosphotransferase